MATLTVFYPRTAGAKFDLDYYHNTHLPLVGERWGDAGLSGGEALIGKPGPDGSEPAFVAVGVLHFESDEALQAALGGEHAAEVIGDIAKFTDIQPVMQINDRIRP